MFTRTLAIAGLAFIVVSGPAKAASTASVTGSVTFEFTNVPDNVLTDIIPPAEAPATQLPSGFSFDIFAEGMNPGDASSASLDLSDPFNSFFLFAFAEIPDGFTGPLDPDPFEIGFTLGYNFMVSTIFDGSAGIPSAGIDLFALTVGPNDLVTLDAGSSFPILPTVNGPGMQNVSGTISGTIFVPSGDFFGQIDFAARAAVSPVPLPAAAWLLLASLGALAGGGLATRRRAA